MGRSLNVESEIALILDSFIFATYILNLYRKYVQTK